jgi:hypothetical protein
VAGHGVCEFAVGVNRTSGKIEKAKPNHARPKPAQAVAAVLGHDQQRGVRDARERQACCCLAWASHQSLSDMGQRRRSQQRSVPFRVRSAELRRTPEPRQGLFAAIMGMLIAYKGLFGTINGLFAVDKGLSVTAIGMFAANNGLSATNMGMFASNKGLSAEIMGMFAANNGLSGAIMGLFAANNGLSGAIMGMCGANK